MAIDLFGFTEEQVRHRFPAVFQHTLLHVKPERGQNNRASRKANWWLFGENVLEHREGVRGLSRYIATAETAKHRVFSFLPAAVLPDNKLICIATAILNAPGPS